MLHRTAQFVAFTVLENHFIYFDEAYLPFPNHDNEYVCSICEPWEKPLARRFIYAPQNLVRQVEKKLFKQLGKKIIGEEEDVYNKLVILADNLVHDWIEKKNPDLLLPVC